jgi:hypothetical protein
MYCRCCIPYSPLTVRYVEHAEENVVIVTDESEILLKSSYTCVTNVCLVDESQQVLNGDHWHNIAVDLMNPDWALVRIMLTLCSTASPHLPCQPVARCLVYLDQWVSLFIGSHMTASGRLVNIDVLMSSLHRLDVIGIQGGALLVLKD